MNVGDKYIWSWGYLTVTRITDTMVYFTWDEGFGGAYDRKGWEAFIDDARHVTSLNELLKQYYKL